MIAVMSSPMNSKSPIVSDTVDKDINDRMRNMAMTETTPPTLSPNRPTHQYHSYPNSGQHQPFTPSNQPGYAQYPQYQSQPGYPIHQSQMGYQSQPGYQTQPGYSHRPSYYESAPSDFSLETMHGMPGYPGQPPVPRNLHSVSPLYSGPSNASLTPRPYGWGTPPMSPAMSTGHFGGMPSRGYGRPVSYNPGPQEEYGAHSPMVYNDGSGWMPPVQQYNYYPPFQPQQPAPRDQYHSPRPPMATQGFQQHRASYADQRPPANRMAWTGQAGGDQKDRERKAYHPQPPARRSDWVMWVGNV
jgi:hypothetical protein